MQDDKEKIELEKNEEKSHQSKIEIEEIKEEVASKE